MEYFYLTLLTVLTTSIGLYIRHYFDKVDRHEKEIQNLKQLTKEDDNEQ